MAPQDEHLAELLQWKAGLRAVTLAGCASITDAALQVCFQHALRLTTTVRAANPDTYWSKARAQAACAEAVPGKDPLLRSVRDRSWKRQALESSAAVKKVVVHDFPPSG